MELLQVAALCMIVAVISYAWGHWAGYLKGEDDTLARAKGYANSDHERDDSDNWR